MRRAVVAGQFYPAARQELRNQISSFIEDTQEKSGAMACMLPHAGYIYSGAVAAKTLCRVNIKDKIVLLGPNHTGYGEQFSIMTEGVWQTPLGEVRIDSQLAKQILKGCELLKDDTLAHAYEHSLEVELPLLQYFKTDFQIVPIAFMSDDTAALKKIGKDMALSIKEAGLEKEVFIVASSDMTHYEPQDAAQRKDTEAIGAILELNEDKLVEKIRKLNISMCGYAPVVAMLSAVKALGAKQAKLIAYQTSGDITGDYDSVVGYAGMLIS